jgi:hypothetical protein|tara:strand:+ start:448 stop:1254 length:807 start_codon:yes stop_codon:yes gene_type:complete
VAIITPVGAAWGILPPPETTLGEAYRQQFIADFLNIVGDTRLLWLPKNTDTTTTTGADLNGNTITYDATIAGDISTQGAGVAVDRDGSADFGEDTSDSDIYSFGDSADDEPFSIVVLCKPDVNDTVMSLVSKANSASAEEYLFQLTGNGYPQLVIYDESATANFSGTYETAAGTDWTLLSASYDGSGSLSSLKNYVDGAPVTTALADSGTYVAMENTAATIRLAAKYTTEQDFFDGNMALVAIVAKRLNDHENWQIKELVNGFFDLSL